MYSTVGNYDPKDFPAEGENFHWDQEGDDQRPRQPSEGEGPPGYRARQNQQGTAILEGRRQVVGRYEARKNRAPEGQHPDCYDPRPAENREGLELSSRGLHHRAALGAAVYHCKGEQAEPRDGGHDPAPSRIAKSFGAQQGQAPALNRHARLPLGRRTRHPPGE